MEFANDTDVLVSSCRDEWLAIYDQEVMPLVCMVVVDTASMHVHPQTCIVLQYVDNLLAGLVSFQPELQQLLQQLHDQAHLAAQASEAEAAKFAGKSATASRKRTKPEPFNLTQPKPKLQPIEEPLPPPIKYAQPCLPSAHQLFLNICDLVRYVQDQE